MLTNAESTWLEAAWEDGKLLINLKGSTERLGFFHYINIDTLTGILMVAVVAGRSSRDTMSAYIVRISPSVGWFHHLPAPPAGKRFTLL